MVNGLVYLPQVIAKPPRSGTSGEAGLLKTRTCKFEKVSYLANDYSSQCQLRDRSRQFSLLGAGVDKAIAGTHSETLPEDIELASNEYYMRHDVEVTEHVDRY